MSDSCEEFTAIATARLRELEEAEVERDQLRQVIDSECPIGAFDLATTWRTEKQVMMDELERAERLVEELVEAASPLIALVDANTVPSDTWIFMGTRHFQPLRDALARAKEARG